MAGVLSPNAKKVSPGSQLGTPELQFILVAANENLSTGSTASNSIFAQAVNVIQGFMEVYIVGTPGANGFIIAVNKNTSNNFDSDGTANGYGLVEAGLNAITGISGASLTNKTLTNNGLS